MSGGGAPWTPCTEEATEAPAGAPAHGGEALALLLGPPGPQTPHCLAAATPVGASSPAGPSGAEAPSPRLYSFSATHLSTHLPITQEQRHSSNDSRGLGFRSVQSAKHWAGALHAVWRLLQGPCNVPELLGRSGVIPGTLSLPVTRGPCRARRTVQALRMFLARAFTEHLLCALARPTRVIGARPAF